MFCRQCGNEIQDGAKFCNICGKEIQRTDELTHRDNGIKRIKLNQNYYEHRKGGTDSIPFSRPPRVIVPLSERTIDIENPPAIAQKPEINWISVFLPPIAMAVLLVAISYFTDNSSSYMFMMLPMQAISVIIAIVNYWLQVRKHKKEAREREIKYSDYLAGIKDDLEKSAVDQLKIMQEKNPSPVQCMQIVLEQGKSLWERKPEDSDFCTFRLGTGTVEAVTKATYPKQQLSLSSDPLEDAARELCDSYKEVANAPIVTSIRDGIIGIVGDSQSTKTLAQKIIVQLSTLHSYEDLKLGLICQQADINDWAWVRWLRHFRDAENDRFLFATTPTEASQIKEILLNIVNQRKANERDYGEFRKVSPQYILFITAPDMLWDRTLFDEINQAKLSLGVSMVILSESIDQLPKSCKRIIEIHEASGATYPTNNRNERTRFAADLLHFSALDAIARAMAPVYLSEASLRKKMPEQISFFEGYGLKQITDYDLAAAWASADVGESLAAPIGIDENGNLFSFDICDGKMGVHGLVGGMSGSGKSEMIQSWILSMAMNYSPQDVSFVLIDFKGTGLITPFRGLPHIAGTISNIDSDIRRNQISLDYELLRRQKLFDSVGVQYIKDYCDRYKAGKAPEKLSILIVVIDEFAEFKKAFPQFMDWVESNFTKGRSLGIWFVLATQQPDSTASEPIKTNTGFKWCFKVNTASASKEIIGIPDAVQITRPGRGYIHVKNPDKDFTKCIQSFWSGAPYNPKLDNMQVDYPIAVIGLDGKRTIYSDSRSATQSEHTEIEAAVTYIAEYAKTHHIPKAKKIWADKLPERLFLGSVCKSSFNGNVWSKENNTFDPVVGEVDDPQHQCKYPLVVSFSRYGSIAVHGAPTTGKTTFLQTLIMSSALLYSPENLNIYIMDFGSLSLRVFSDMPQVGGIVELSQPKRVEKLITLLSDELEQRRNLFAEAKVGDIAVFRDAISKQMPYILLVVDNYQKEYPKDSKNKSTLEALEAKLEDFFLQLLTSGAKYGMYMAVSITGGADGIKYKFRDSFKMKYALQLVDKGAYIDLVGKPELLPENVMGRGLAKGNPPLQFQTALPVGGKTDVDVSRNIQRVSEIMRNAWKPRREAPPIPEMPSLIPFGSITEPGIHLGLSTEKVRPVDYSPEQQHYLLISGTEKSGKSNMLLALAKQIRSAMRCKTYCFDVKGVDLQSMNPDCRYTEAKEIDQFFEQLSVTLENRESLVKSGVTEFEPILLVVDDYGMFFDLVSNDTIDRIRPIIMMGSGLGVYLLVACDANRLSFLKNHGEKVAVALCKAKQSVLLGGCINDHPELQLNVSYSQKSNVVNEHEGFYIQNGNVTRFKTMHA